MVSSNDAGIQKVIDDGGKYAFFMESASIEYIVERKCKVTQVGGLLDNKVSILGVLSLCHRLRVDLKTCFSICSLLFQNRVMELQWLIIHLTRDTLIKQF